MAGDPFECHQLAALGPSCRVYRGVEPATGRWVRLKSLHDPGLSPWPLHHETLQHIAPVLLAWRHPHVAALLAWCPAEETPVLVHEWCPGIEARVLPARQRLASADLRALAWQLVELLQQARLSGLTHGALHPGNVAVMGLAGAHRISVRDWGLGLARAAVWPEALACWSPQRLEGGRACAQDDLFAAACCVYQLAHARLPVEGGGAAALIEQWSRLDLEGQSRWLRPDLEESLRLWLCRLLHPRLDQRCTEPAEALALLCGGSPRAQIPRAQPKAPSPRRPAQARSAKTCTAPVEPMPWWRRVMLLLSCAFLLGLTLHLAKKGWHRRWLDAVLPSKQAQIPVPKEAAPNAGLQVMQINIGMRGLGSMGFSEIEAYDQSRNVASEAQAWQSSSYRGAVAGLAVDGKPGTSSQTQGADRDPVWTLTWPVARRITRLVILPRPQKAASGRSLSITLQDSLGVRVWNREWPEMPASGLSFDLP